MSELEFDIGHSAPFHTARDPVNLPTIRRWCDAMGYDNPAHLDPDIAARTRLGRISAPMTMLDTWTNPGLAYRRDVGDPRGAAYEILDRAGYTSAVAVGSELRQLRPLVLGDLVRSTITLERVTDEKETALGVGRFVTTRLDYLVDDEHVGTVRFTVLKFEPVGDSRQAGDAGPRADVGSWPVTPEVARDALGTVRAKGLREGMHLPRATVAITTTLVVSGAIASADFFEPHHDRDAAVARGSRDIFMNIHTTLGLLERCVGHWLGPDTEWRSVSTRLGVPNHPGDVMTVSPQVAHVDPATGEVRVDVEATNGLGTHATASFEARVPQ